MLQALSQPVIVLAGQAHASRVGVSLLTHRGQQELIGKDVDDYVRLAVELAGNHEQLKSMREAAREQMRTSPLCDGPAFTRDFEKALHVVMGLYRSTQPA